MHIVFLREEEAACRQTAAKQQLEACSSSGPLPAAAGLAAPVISDIIEPREERHELLELGAGGGGLLVEPRGVGEREPVGVVDGPPAARGSIEEFVKCRRLR